MEDYGFEYSDDDFAEADVDIENQYYNSKGLIESEELTEALEGFQQVVSMEESKGEWYGLLPENFTAIPTRIIIHCCHGKGFKYKESLCVLLSLQGFQSLEANSKTAL